MSLPAWSCWVRRFTAPYLQVWGKSSLQRHLAEVATSQTLQIAKGSSVCASRWQGRMFSRTHTSWGNSQQLTPVAGRSTQIPLHGVRGRRRIDTQLTAPHQYFVCSLQIQLWFLPVTQIPQLHIAVASVVGATVHGLSAQYCRILVQPWASQLRPGHSRTLPSRNNICLLPSETELELQTELTCLHYPVPVLAGCHGWNCTPGFPGNWVMSLQTFHFVQGTKVADKSALASLENRHKHCIRDCSNSEVKNLAFFFSYLSPQFSYFFIIIQ